MKLKVLIALLLSTSFLCAQNFVFNRTYNLNNLYDFMQGVYETDSCYYAIHNHHGNWPDGRYISLLRLEKNGNITWDKELFRAGDSATYLLATQALMPLTKDILMTYGNYEEHPDSSNSIFMYTFKDNGDSLMFKTYPKEGYQRILELKRLSDKSFIACGVDQSGNTKTDMYVVKFDRFRNKVWEQVYPEDHLQIAYSISPAPDGGYFVVGRSNQYVEHYEIKALKIDSVGNLEWTRTFGGGNNGIVYHGLVLNDGNYLLAGSLENDFGGYSSYLVKFNESGEVIWEYHDDRNDTNRFCSKIFELDDGSLVIGGERKYFGALSARLSKFSSTGELIWESYHAGRNAAPLLFYGIEQAQDGGYFLHGSAFGPDPITLQDAWLVKTNSEGYSCEEVDCLEVLTNDISIEKTATFNVFPNPANEEIHISIPELVSNSDMMISIVNISGQLVFETNEVRNEMHIDVKQLPAGIYFLQLLSGRKLLVTKKLMIQ